jgi:hypothetical protein
VEGFFGGLGELALFKDRVLLMSIIFTDLGKLQSDIRD